MDNPMMNGMCGALIGGYGCDALVSSVSQLANQDFPEGAMLRHVCPESCDDCDGHHDDGDECSSDVPVCDSTVQSNFMAMLNGANTDECKYILDDAHDDLEDSDYCACMMSADFSSFALDCVLDECEDITLNDYVTKCPSVCSEDIGTEVLTAATMANTPECIALLASGDSAEGEDEGDNLCPCLNSFDSSKFGGDDYACLLDLSQDESFKATVERCSADDNTDAPVEVCEDLPQMGNNCALLAQMGCDTPTANIPQLQNQGIPEGALIKHLCKETCGECDDVTEAPTDDAGTEAPEDGSGTEAPEDGSGTEAPEDDAGTEAPTEPATEAPAPTKEVKFELKLSISEEEFNTHKETIKADIATLLNTVVEKIRLALKTRRRRRLQDAVDIEVTVQADDDAAATAVEDAVTGSSFEQDLGESVSTSTGLTVTVSDVSDPVTESLTETPASSDDDDDNTTMIIIIIVVVVAVLAIGGFICYTMNKNEKLKDQVGGGETPDKRTPGLQEA